MENETLTLMMAKQMLILTGKLSAALPSSTFHAEIPCTSVCHVANQSADAVGEITFSVNQVPDLIPTLPVLSKHTGEDLISIKSKLQLKYIYIYILGQLHSVCIS